MKLNEIIQSIEVWTNWVNSYKKYVPQFIEEAKTKDNWEDWDKDVFREYFEQARNQCVSSLQQGYFTHKEREKIRTNWRELAPLFKQIAENQTVPLFDVYLKVEDTIRKYTDVHRRASTFRLIAGLQPELLCTIVNQNNLYELFTFLKKNIEEPISDYTGNWYKDSFTVAQYYKDHVKDIRAMNLIAYPWQTLVYFEEGKEITTNEMSENNIIKGTESNSSNRLNQILYGPPGTGKTYNTINKALSIIEPENEGIINSEDRSILKKRFDDYLKKGQIVFTTFHQSMSYEDFIEGIKPIKPKSDESPINYKIEDGIFKEIVKKAIAEYINIETDDNSDDSFDTLYNQFIESIAPLKGTRQAVFKTKTDVELMLVNANGDSIQVKYLWSNKDKDFEGQHVFSVTKSKLKKALLAGIVPSKNTNLIKELHPIVGHIHCELFGVYKKFYDFVIENKVELETIHYDASELTFEEVKEQFDLLSKEEIKSKNIKPYVLIIDEINRGNVSQIFGELITLIEDDKRLSKDEALEVMLPYSKEKFGVPPNLYIIGTMNTADRSVEALDTALRRRFSFEEMPPKYKVEKNSNDLLSEMVYGYSLEAILRKINTRIEKLLDKDHLIGHAYFLNKNEETIIESFYKNIIPLLQEYFYGDYSKIGLVLGKSFVDFKEAGNESIFADFHGKGDDYSDRETYSIIKHNEITFGDALKSLMS